MNQITNYNFHFEPWSGATVTAVTWEASKKRKKEK